MQLAAVIILPLPVPGSIAELITFLAWGLFGSFPDLLGTPSTTSHNEPLLCRAGSGLSLLVPSSARHNWYYAHVPRRVPAGRGEGSRLSMPAAAALAGRSRARDLSSQLYELAGGPGNGAL